MEEGSDALYGCAWGVHQACNRHRHRLHLGIVSCEPCRIVVVVGIEVGGELKLVNLEGYKDSVHRRLLQIDLYFVSADARI